MSIKVTLTKLDLTNLLRSVITITAALRDPRIAPVSNLSDAFVLEQFEGMVAKLSKGFPCRRSRKVSFSYTELTAIVMFEETNHLWHQLDDAIQYPITEINMELMKHFINWLSIHNLKKKEYDYSKSSFD
jgi:hypothetical protein